MKKFFLFLLLFLVVAGIAGFSYFKLVLPNVDPAPDLKITATTTRVEHGKYLANHVMLCVDCHSTRNYTLYAAPIIPGTEGKGGEVLDQKGGFPGVYVIPNITPAHLGKWTDGEIFRAITSGVNKDGKALFPMMPYLSFGKIDREDIYDVIAYIRTLKPIVNETPASKSDFPMSLIINTVPQKASFTTKPDKNNAVAYGQYLMTAAACGDCHTPQEKGKPIEGMTFAGGRQFPMPGITVQSANITPDKNSGIGNWTEQQFVDRFKSYDLVKHPAPKVNTGEMNTIMPWTRYADLDTTDLKAIYQYLRTVKPVNHKVEKLLLAKN